MKKYSNAKIIFSGGSGSIYHNVTHAEAAKLFFTNFEINLDNIIYESKAGLVCPSGDSVQLSKNILKISGMSSQELFEMGNNSLNYYKKNYERKMLLDKVENIFSKVINIKIS